MVITNPQLLERNREMAQKSINVKVSTKKVIDALQKALDARKKQIADHAKAQENHKKAIADWEKAVAEYVKSGKAKITEVGYQGNNWRMPDNAPKLARIEVALPASLSFPEQEATGYAEWQVKSEIDELENAIAVLRMTDEEVVSTSTYKGVAQYIK